MGDNLPAVYDAPDSHDYTIDGLLQYLASMPHVEIRHTMGDIAYRLCLKDTTGPDTVDARPMNHHWSDVILVALRKGYLLQSLPKGGLDFVYSLSPRGLMKVEFPVGKNPPSPFDSIETLCHMARSIPVDQINTMSTYGRLGYLSNDVQAFLAFRQELALIDEQEQDIAAKKQ